MKYVPRMPIPWDMIVFLTITTSGFAFSVHRMVVDPVTLGAEARELASSSSRESMNQTTADLGCLEKSLPKQKLNSDAGTIRLRGKFCHLSRRAMRSFDGMHIRNKTNGFEGTVFFQGYDATFVSDYMVLAQGRNEIEIEWRESATSPARKVVAEVFDN